MSEDRAAILARIADESMHNGGRLPSGLPAGCTDLSASLYPEAPDEPCEVHFSATWPGITITCSRSLAGYSLDGGLHPAGGRSYPIYVPGQAEPVGWLREMPYIGCVSCGRASADCRCDAEPMEDGPAETELRWSICTDCGMRDLVTGLRDPLCAYCGELRTLPPRPLTGRPMRRLLVAAVLAACCLAVGVLTWFVPASDRMIMNLAAWSLALAAWAVIGWRALGRRRRRGH